MESFNQGQQDLIGILREIISEETKWLRHYQGRVLKNVDPDNLNRICISIPELGWEDENMAFWAFPRDKNNISTPDIGANVEIYFMAGDPSRPVYLGLCWEGYNSKPVKNYDGKPGTHILFEDPKIKESYIKYNNKVFDISKILSLDVANKALTILQGTEPFILGNSFKTYFDTHVHTSAAVGNPTSPPTIAMPTITLSTVIKGK